MPTRRKGQTARQRAAAMRNLRKAWAKNRGRKRSSTTRRRKR